MEKKRFCLKYSCTTGGKISNDLQSLYGFLNSGTLMLIKRLVLKFHICLLIYELLTIFCDSAEIFYFNCVLMNHCMSRSEGFGWRRRNSGVKNSC
jgi:hypothetical protein